MERNTNLASGGVSIYIAVCLWPLATSVQKSMYSGLLIEYYSVRSTEYNGWLSYSILGCDVRFRYTCWSRYQPPYPTLRSTIIGHHTNERELGNDSWSLWTLLQPPVSFPRCFRIPGTFSGHLASRHSYFGCLPHTMNTVCLYFYISVTSYRLLCISESLLYTTSSLSGTVASGVQSNATLCCRCCTP